MSYNGWKNYETWAVQLWLENEEPSYRHWRRVAQEVWALSAEGHDILTRSQLARRDLGELLQSAHQDGTPAGVDNTVYADLLNGALGEVDWLEIANAWLEGLEVEGYAARKEHHG